MSDELGPRDTVFDPRAEELAARQRTLRTLAELAAIVGQSPDMKAVYDELAATAEDDLADPTSEPAAPIDPVTGAYIITDAKPPL